MSTQGTRTVSADGAGLSYRIAAWIESHSTAVFVAFLVATALLVLPLLLVDTPDPASQDPRGRVFELQERIDDSFASPVHAVPFIIESRTGDILTAESLSSILLAETRLRAADSRLELTPPDLPAQEFLLRYFDNSTERNAVGIITIADAVEEYLRTTSGGELSLFEASDEQVKVAVHHVLSDPRTADLVEFLSIRAEAETRVVDGETVLWWISPALQVNVLADNERLGGGTQAIGVSADDRTVDKEEFNRNVQAVLRENAEGYEVWGIAIDANLEAIDQGQESGLFIALTVIAAIAIVGVTLRSYWAVALTGIGLGSLMIWLKGISLLVGLKSGLVIDLIVPIAMVSLGVDFAVHAVRRYQEERLVTAIPGRALAIGLGAVLPALALAMASDSIAFLANTSAGIEAVIHFGIAATIATASSFIVLGIVLPQAYARVDGLLAGRKLNGRFRRATIIVSSIGAASAAGGAVILLVAVHPAPGAVFLLLTFVLTVLAPVLYLSRRKVKGPTGEAGPAFRSSGTAVDRPLSHPIDVLYHATRYRYLLLGAIAGITAGAAIFALRLDATFDVKDFFSSDSDFAVSLDRLDEHVGSRSGEPATILVEGDFSEPSTLGVIQAVHDNLDGNQNLGRDSRGLVTIAEPNFLQIVLDITASEAGRNGVLDLTGVEIEESPPYGVPQEKQQLEALMAYAVREGVPTEGGQLAYTPADVRSVLRHNPLGSTLDLTRLTVFLPGTREQSTVARARDSIERDLVSLESSDAITDYGVTGSPIIRQAQLEATTDSLQTSIPIAAAAALLLLVVAFRSVRFAIVTIIPIGLVVIWLYAIMYLTGFALNFVTATIGAVSIGVGIDFSIHLTQRFREELAREGSGPVALRAALRGTGVALAGSAASSIVGFAIMGLAPMPLFSSYGILTSIMVFLALVSALVVLPSLLLVVTPGHSRESTARNQGQEMRKA